MNRVKESELFAILERINRVREARGLEGQCVLSFAYGGVQLQREHPSGGTSVVIPGYRTKRELRDLMHAYVDGLTGNR